MSAELIASIVALLGAITAFIKSHTDNYGFSVFPAGYRISGSFYDLGSNAFFWTATENSSTNAYYRYFSTGASMGSSNNNKTNDAYSVRLVKD